MKGKSHRPDQIGVKLREADKLLTSGRSVAEAVKQLEIAARSRVRRAARVQWLSAMDEYFSAKLPLTA